ncbi:MAG: methyl-accepting chemotaxis protein [Solirubrobacterales bacterium]
MDAAQRAARRTRAIRQILPRWFVDLDTAHKPLVIAVTMLVVAVPLLAIAFVAGLDMHEAEGDLKRLLALDSASLADMQSATRDFDAANWRARWAFFGASVWIFVVALGGAYVSSSLATAWLRDLVRFTDEAASGDLTRVIERDNETQIGDVQEALGKMLASFSATIRRIELAADELNGAASEMAHTSDEAGHAIGEVAQAVSSISEGAAHQVDLVTRTSDVVAEIETAITDAASTASDAQLQSAETEKLTEEGVARATEVQEAMQAVRDTSAQTATVVRSLGEKSSDIDQIVRAITDIAAQTNLLALNAAIEAARAGEQGRGFAVVAEEVRRLAEDAQHSAGDIAVLIGEIREQTEEAVIAMEAGVERVESGSEVVSRNRQTFYDISGAVRAFHETTAEIASLAKGISIDAGRVREQIEEVASVAEESSASTEQVSASTQQTAAAAQEVTASAQRVAQTAVNLAELAKRFKVRFRPEDHQ